MRRTSTRLAAALALIAGMIALGAHPVAGAGRPYRHIYWSNFGDGTIGRANLDGTGVKQDLVTGIGEYGGPTAVAVGNGFNYWGNYGTTDFGMIGRATLNGRYVDPDFITADSSVQGLAVDGRYIYWSNIHTGTIGRARVGGAQVDQEFITGLEGPSGLFVDGQHIYWGDAWSESIGRANLDGTGVDPSFIAPVEYPWDVALDGEHIYWTDFVGYYPPYGPGYIGRADLDGSDVDGHWITTTTGNLAELVVHDGRLYWANADGAIAMANVDGTGMDESFITGCSFPWGLAVGP